MTIEPTAFLQKSLHINCQLFKITGFSTLLAYGPKMEKKKINSDCTSEGYFPLLIYIDSHIQVVLESILIRRSLSEFWTMNLGICSLSPTIILADLLKFVYHI